MTDAETVRGVLGGETGLFGVLVERHQDYLFRLIGRHLPSSETEETAQQVFLEAFENLTKLRAGDSFKSWIAAIAVRRCADFWRRTKRRREVSFDPCDPAQTAWLDEAARAGGRERLDDLAGRIEAENLVAKLLDELGPEDRLAVGLFYAEEQSLAEIGDMLGWGLAKVKVRLHRARAKMARAYDAITHGRGNDHGR